MPEFITGAVARWEVIWWSRKKKMFIVKVFGNDLAGAEALYMVVARANAPLATLRCCNVGWPPPEKYRPYTKTMAKRVRVRGKVKKVPVEVEVTPMTEVNLKGVWWCPYCRKMRKFKELDGMMYTDPGGHEYYLDGKIWACPVCQITHTNHHVRKWNPHAQRMPFRKIKATRVRRSNGSNRRRTRRRK